MVAGCFFQKECNFFINIPDFMKLSLKMLLSNTKNGLFASVDASGFAQGYAVTRCELCSCRFPYPPNEAGTLLRCRSYRHRNAPPSVRLLHTIFYLLT